MADEENNEQVTAPRRTGTRVPWFVMGFIILLFAVGGLLVKKKKPSPPTNPGARALIVPTDRARTVVVPPCATGVGVTAQDAAGQAGREGSIRLTLQAGRGVRVVLVPRCTLQAGKSTGTSISVPSAAFVLPVDAKGPAANGGKGIGISAGTEGSLVVPQGSTVATIVVPACEKSNDTSGTNQAVVGPLQPGGTVALAPDC